MFTPGGGTSNARTFEIETLSLPTLSTNAATSITTGGATLNGNITATGGEDADQRGFRYRKTGTSTWTNWTQTGPFDTGAFTHPVTGLSAGTGYEYQAMAHNSAGWAYGSTRSFTTVSLLSTWYLAEGRPCPPSPPTYPSRTPTRHGTRRNHLLHHLGDGIGGDGHTAGQEPGHRKPGLQGGRQGVQHEGGLHRGQAHMRGPHHVLDRSRGSRPRRTLLVGVSAPAKTWYLPEGSTNWGFETKIALMNPNSLERHGQGDLHDRGLSARDQDQDHSRATGGLRSTWHLTWGQRTPPSR